jgi:hypothetical protein
MATFNYTKLIATTHTLLAKFGNIGVIGDSGTARNVLMVRIKTVDKPLLESNIDVGDYKYIVNPTVDVTGVDSLPVVGERMSFKGELMNIVHVNKMKPEALTLYYEVWGRLG